MMIDLTVGPRKKYFTSNNPDSSLYAYEGVKSTGKPFVRIPRLVRKNMRMKAIRYINHHWDHETQYWVGGEI
jgi:hypothetical protein